MKKLMMAAATLVLFTSAANAQHQTAEYRMYSAEQMINRLTEKYAKANQACDQTRVKVWMPRLSEECKAAVAGAYPMLGVIREVAMSGDALAWAKLVDIVHEMETGIDPMINGKR